MRIEKTFHYCDRCGQEFKDDDDRKRVGRLLEINKKIVTECKVIIYKNANMNETRKGFELCEECRENLEVWLSGKNA